MVRGGVLVSHGHLGCFVAHDFHDGFEVAAVHSQPGTEGVAQIMVSETDREAVSPSD